MSMLAFVSTINALKILPDTQGWGLVIKCLAERKCGVTASFLKENPLTVSVNWVTRRMGKNAKIKKGRNKRFR